MNTEKNTEKNIDDQIMAANAPGDVSEPTGKHDAHQIYWILRDKFGLSHLAAVDGTHLLRDNIDGVVVKSWRDLDKKEVRAYVAKVRAMLESKAQQIESLHSNRDRQIPADLAALFGDFQGDADCDDLDDDLTDDSTVPRS